MSVVHTNKVPVATVRGAGYPQAAFVMERVLDRIAQGVGIDRAECRRRNLIPADQIPYVKPLKSRAGVPLTIDSGDFPALQARALAEIGYAEFDARRRKAAARGLCRGIGLANGVKPTGRGPFESARVRIAPSGQISVYTGALAMGQGIATTLAQLCAAHFGVAAQAVQVRAGDTAFVSHGMGGFASRQAMMAGSAVTLAAGRVRAKAIRSAAALLGVEEDCLLLADGEIKTPDGRAVCWRGWPPCGRACRDTRCRVATIPGWTRPRISIATRNPTPAPRMPARSRSIPAPGGASAALRGGARQRPHHQSRAGRRPGPRRRGARHWQRPVRVDGL